MPSVVLITGMSGAGKSTLAELLRGKYGLVHFDGDCWIVGRDPVAEAGAIIPPEDFQAMPEKVPEIAKLKEAWNAEGRNIFAGGTPDIGPIERFYTPLVASVKEVHAANPGKGIVMSHAAFLREERDVLRKLFGDDFACLVLCSSSEVMQIVDWSERKRKQPRLVRLSRSM